MRAPPASSQFVVIILSIVTVTRSPEMRFGMTGLLAVLTTSTFLYTSELYNSSFGIFALCAGPSAVPPRPRPAGAAPSPVCCIFASALCNSMHDAPTKTDGSPVDRHAVRNFYYYVLRAADGPARCCSKRRARLQEALLRLHTS